MNMGPMSVSAYATDDDETSELTKLPPNVNMALDQPEADLITIGEEGAEGVVTVAVTNDGDGEVLVVLGESGTMTAVQPGKTLFVESKGHIEVRE